ncbi:MAG: PH domain-containing protein [Vicinamibacterales bacterium]
MAIRTLRASCTLLASPALSLNRIEVLASPGPYVVISPADRAGFLRDILSRALQIRLEGLDRWRRTERPREGWLPTHLAAGNKARAPPVTFRRAVAFWVT